MLRRESFDDRKGGDFVFNPEHGGRHVTDRGPSATSVGRHDHHKGVDEPLMPCWDDFFEERDHQNGGSEVIEDRGEEKGRDCDEPEHFPAGGRLDQVSNDLNPLWESTSSTKVIAPMRKKMIWEICETWWPSRLRVSFKRCGTHDEVEGPAEGSGEKSCRRLVDLEGMFEDDDAIADPKKDQNREKKITGRHFHRKLTLVDMRRFRRGKWLSRATKSSEKASRPFSFSKREG